MRAMAYHASVNLTAGLVIGLFPQSLTEALVGMAFVVATLLEGRLSVVLIVWEMAVASLAP